MRRAIFRFSFQVGLLVLFLCALLFFGLQVRQTLDETYAALRQEAFYAEHGLMMNGEEYLRTLGEINRITWIAPDGSVLYDSEFPLPIPNQIRYPEVSSALSAGEGQGIRRSDSSGVRTMYVALRAEDGSILRLSRPLSTVRYALISVSPVLWVVLLVLLIASLFSFRTARRIVAPINALDLERLETAPYPELSPLVSRIREQKQTILDQTSEHERLRREFSANVSHELKTPLTSISGFAELMAAGVVSPDKIQEFSQDIYKESQRLIALIDDIMRLSRLDEDAIEFEWEAVDIYALSADVLDSLRPLADRRQISLSLHGEPTVIYGVSRLLGEMVWNLCENAVKYNRPGGRVTVSVFDRDGRTCLTVSDNGIGIPPESQSRVFERFYRVDKSHSKSVGGTGLGLSIVKHVALYHRAELTLESTPDLGTTVTVCFAEQES